MNNEDQLKDTNYDALKNNDPEVQNNENQNQEVAEPANEPFIFNGQSIDLQKNAQQSMISNICSSAIMAILFFIFTRDGQMDDGVLTCIQLRVYGVDFVYFSIALTIISIACLISLRFFKSNWLMAFYWLFNFVGTLVFMVLFQIGWSNGSKCHGLGILVIISLIFFYIVCAIFVCACLCLCCCVGAMASSENNKENELIKQQQ